jgi:hypothetical protein
VLYISGHELLIIAVVFVVITVGPPVAAWVLAKVRRWKERKKKQG